MAADREDFRQIILDLYAYMAEKPDEGLEYRIDWTTPSEGD